MKVYAEDVEDVHIITVKKIIVIFYTNINGNGAQNDKDYLEI